MIDVSFVVNCHFWHVPLWGFLLQGLLIYDLSFLYYLITAVICIMSTGLGRSLPVSLEKECARKFPVSFEERRTRIKDKLGFCREGMFVPTLVHTGDCQ